MGCLHVFVSSVGMRACSCVGGMDIVPKGWCKETSRTQQNYNIQAKCRFCEDTDPQHTSSEVKDWVWFMKRPTHLMMVMTNGDNHHVNGSCVWKCTTVVEQVYPSTGGSAVQFPAPLVHFNVSLGKTLNSNLLP